MRLKAIPMQSQLDDPEFLMKELMKDYERDWIETCAAAIEAGYLLAAEPARLQ